MRNSFELALDHLGRKMGGLPVEVIYEDDGFKPEVGKQKTEKLIESDKVDFIAGYIWSNVLLASLKPVVDSKTFLVIANAGPSQVAGELCSPSVFSTSWQNDQTPQAMGLYMNQKGVKKVFLIGPNYAAGKDMLAGVASTFKGKVVGQELTTWPDAARLLRRTRQGEGGASRTRSSCSIRAAAGVQFLTQYAQAGLKGKSRSTPPSPSMNCRCRCRRIWRSACPARRNGSTTCRTTPTRSSSPTTSQEVPRHDAVVLRRAEPMTRPMLIDSRGRRRKGNLSDKAAVHKAMEKADFKSVRGNFKFGNNHVPIQNFYLQDVVKNAEGDSCSRPSPPSSRTARTASTTNAR